VPRLDVAPPTSSFPSGHTGAAVATYGCIAYIVLRYAVHRALARVAAIALCLVPVCVGLSRLYRGMHFPSDVLAGALGGGLWLLVVLVVLMPWHSRSRSGADPSPSAVRTSAPTGPVASDRPGRTPSGTAGATRRARSD